MTTSTPTAPPAGATGRDYLQRVGELVRRAETGQPLTFAEVAPYTSVPEPAARALAKRLMAQMVISQARTDASRLLCEACADLDFRHDGLLDETLVQLYQFGLAREMFDLQIRAAEASLRRRDYDGALVHAQNAVGADTKLGEVSSNDSLALRKLISLYERIAAETRSQAGLADTARGKRRSPAGGKLRLAHVTCQLVDTAHGPTRAIDTMLRLADRERFDNYLVVTESLVQYTRQRHQMLTTSSTTTRAPKRLARIRDEYGVPVLLPQTTDTFLLAAADLHRQMAAHQIDVAFFHGSIITPVDWLLCAWQAAPWQFDRGFGKPLFCPAVHYQFFELAPTMEAMSFLCRERGIPFGLSPNGAPDISDAPVTPFDRRELGIPADHVILGTLGNHLDERMGAEFCETVAAVMRACPKTTYIVLGHGKFEHQPRLFGSDLVGLNGPGARVRFLGHTDEPTRWTNTFDIYLNEYPGGGGTSVYEAMYLGKPVVCMNASQSALSAAGVVYVGDENLVTPATSEAYARRLIELINSPAARQALGARLQQRQRQEFNPQTFVTGMTDKIWDVVQADLHNAT